MSSRMERYSNVLDTDYKSTNTNYKNRSDRNRSLYEDIQNLKTYSNIEGVASIENNNEIDITKVRSMIQNRENYKNKKKFGRLLSDENITQETIEEVYKEPKVYDINDALSKIKIEKDHKENHKLTKEQYEFLKKLKSREYDEEKDELEEILNTITKNKDLNNLKDENDVGLLDSLKSDTIVGNASSIKKIIEEEKKNIQNEDDDDDMEIDKSFYTSSFGFTQRDFEELKNMNVNLKKSNKTIIVLLSALILIVISVICFLIVK